MFWREGGGFLKLDTLEMWPDVADLYNLTDPSFKNINK